MTNPKIKTKVVHSQTKSAYNVVGTSLGNKYKIARIPYETRIFFLKTFLGEVFYFSFFVVYIKYTMYICTEII